MKIFIDSNICISAAAFGGAAVAGLDATSDARWRLFLSPTVVDETERIITLKLRLRSAAVRGFLQRLYTSAVMVPEPLTGPTVPGDSNDTPILRAAIAAGCDYLVTGDRQLLLLQKVESLQILSLSDYCNLLRAHGYLK